jgi:hypothetical protein
MKSPTRFLALMIALCALSAPSPAAPQPTPSPQWSEKMRSLYRTLSALMTDVSSDSRFKDPRNRARIQSNAKKLADLAHSLGAKGMAPPDKDPSVGIFARLFADRAHIAYQSIKSGNIDNGRDLLRSIPGYCIACHTRNHSGPSFASLPIEPEGKDLRALERGEFFASTRQYDRALGEFNSVIGDASIASSRPFEWANAVKYALAIAVRVKQDPKLAKEIASKLASSTHAPFFMRENASKWAASIDDWSREPARTATNEEGLYSEAVKLLGQAHEIQKYPMDHSADILYLRASAAVHNLLQVGPNGRHAGEGYLMAGICYEVLSSFRIGELQDIYYEVCVRTNPSTSLATACYHRYQESVYAGYTGSGGTHLPRDEKERLKDLEEIANSKPIRNTPQ